MLSVASILPAAAADPGSVLINEIMYDLPGADDTHEWIELLNTGASSVDVTGWKLNDGDDATNHGLNVPPVNGGQGDMVVNPGEFVILAGNATQFLLDHPGFGGTVIDTVLALGNTERTLTLKDSSLATGATVTYASSQGAAGNGRTLERDNLGWYESTLDGGTPGAANNLRPSVTPTPAAPPSEEGEEGSNTANSVSIAGARNLPKGSDVVVEGVVTVLPGVLSSQYFYIQDGSGGLQVYSSKKLFPNTHIGQRLRISGEISEANNEKRLKIFAASDAVATGSGGAQPRSIRPGEVGESQEGMLVRITGKVVDPSGSTFFIEDETGRVKIYVKKETGIVKPRFQKGDAIAVVGIVSQYKSEYRVLPREQADLITETEEEMEEVETEESDESGEGSGLAENASARVTSVKGAQSERPASRSFLGWALMLSGVLFVLLPLALWMVAARQPETAEKLRNWLARLRSRFGRGMS